jgi:hypothetical protein
MNQFHLLTTLLAILYKLFINIDLIYLINGDYLITH